MKKRIFFSMIICLFISTSCSDSFLEEKRDYSIMSTVDIYSDPEQAKAVFGEIYKKILGNYKAPIHGSDPLMRHDLNGGKFFYFTEEIPVVSPTGGMSGSLGIGSTYFSNSTGKATYAGNHVTGTFYWNGGSGGNLNNWNSNPSTVYPVTYNINRFIEEIKTVAREYSQEDDTFWNHLLGQAIFARAWLYFDATRLYGGLPYYTTDENMPAEDDRSPRLTVQESIDFICEDFQKAAELLPAKWDADNYGRFTSVAALSMISRARLYIASPVYNADWDNTGSRRWQQALDAALAAKSAADAAGITGVSGIDEWDKMFYVTGADSKEAIIAVPKSGNSQYAASFSNSWESLIRPGSVAGSASPGIPAPKQMIDLFPLKDGKRATNASGNPVNGYNSDKFFLNRDPRFYRTFAFSGCEWPGTNTQIWLYAYRTENQFDYTDGSDGTTNAARQKSKALVWKMANPDVLNASLQFSGASILEYRYAELLLNIAECYAAKGDLGQCANYLNMIRNRVGAGSIPAFSSKYEAIEACLYERRVELAYEGKRSWDTRRWLLYEGGAGFDPTNAANTHYELNEAWGQGWKLYDGKEGRANYTRDNNVITMLGLRPISGSKHIGEIWAYDLSAVQTGDPISDAEKAKVPAIKKENEAGRDAALNQLAAFLDTHLKTVDPTAEPMDVSFGMDSNNSSNEQAQNFLFTWRGWFNVYPIHYNQRVVEASNTWITQNVGWNIDNTSTKDQDGTYIYCTPE